MEFIWEKNYYFTTDGQREVISKCLGLRLSGKLTHEHFHLHAGMIAPCVCSFENLLISCV